MAGCVIEGAFEVLSGFVRVKGFRDLTRDITLDDGEFEMFARVALSLKYDALKSPHPSTDF